MGALYRPGGPHWGYLDAVRKLFKLLSWRNHINYDIYIYIYIYP